MKLMAQVVFSGEIEHDGDGAADALRDAGFEVHRMPTVHPELGDPLDDFIEVITEGPAGPPAHDLAYPVGKMTRAMMEDVGDWAECFGGTCMECGPVEDDYVPFTATFHGWTPPPSAVILPFPSREGMK
jgi:hypothetical protein